VGDVACFAEQIARLAGAPEERARLGGLLRERSMTLFSWPAAADRIIDLYRGLTAGRL
jgi:glycosyltransferase involved in cell wall biosynthesis